MGGLPSAAPEALAEVPVVGERGRKEGMISTFLPAHKVFLEIMNQKT